MNKIKPLSEHLTNMIAAGEVIERPSAVLKELIENSIDAQATQIDIDIKNGGLDQILVSDNGIGIRKEDIPTAFLRHATSKISIERDLNHLTSLGFRGEALPSIASVSHIRMITKTKEEMGYRYEVSFGEVQDFEPTQANPGTSIEVTKLFFKQPARLKYLQNPRTEAAQCLSLVQSFALGNPTIGFRYTNEGNEVFKTTGSSNLSQILYQIYGYEVSKSAIEFSQASFDFKIDGVYVSPSIQRASRQYVHIFLNGRTIRYYKISSAIFEVFHRYMPSDRYPIIVLFITTDPVLVDVNVHPSKWEIRLSNELQLIDLVQSTLRQSLTQSMGEKQIRPSIATLPKLEQTLDLSAPSISIVTEETPWIYPEQLSEPKITPPITPVIRAIGQHHGNIIIAQDDQKLYLFDQHAAMERIQYEKIMDQFETHNYYTQPLLLPITINHQQEILAHWEHYEPLLHSFSVFLEPFGNSSLIIREVPSWLTVVDVENFLYSLLDLLLEQKDLSVSTFLKDKIATMACHSSVRFNEVLNLDQMNRIISDLLQSKNPYNCPHGRPTFVSLQAKEVLKEFHR